MKKIGKNTKLYLIGMVIGGITLGITTVIADTIINSTSVAYKTTTVKAALDELYDIADFKEEVKDMLYPVGSIYISVSSTNPSELFGGTWTAFGQGRTFQGVGSNEANTYDGDGTVTTGCCGLGYSEIKGGEYEHILTIAQMPAHGKHLYNISEIWGKGNLVNRYLHENKMATTTGSLGWDAIDGYIAYPTGQTLGNSRPFKISPAYITVFMWKRTA